MSYTVLDDIPVAIIFRGGVGARERLAVLATTTCVTRAVKAGVT